MTEKMNPRIKELWLSALRGGYYDQGTGHLRQIDEIDETESYCYEIDETESYCCWGVLCDLYTTETGVMWVRGEGLHDGTYSIDGDDSMPSDEVLGWAGISPDEKWNYSEYVSSGVTVVNFLAESNDSNECDFNAIANMIEGRL